MAWEYKGKRKGLVAAHRQLLQYAGALENPPLLVASDIIRTDWTNAVFKRPEVLLNRLADPIRLGVLKSVFSDPERLLPNKTRAALTAQAAAEFAELAGRLRNRGNDPRRWSTSSTGWCFACSPMTWDCFPPGCSRGCWTHRASGRRSSRATLAGCSPRWRTRRRGGLHARRLVQRRSVEDDAALALELDDITLLQQAPALDWAEVDPSILGTLFDRGLDPDKRSQLGAHYTSRDMIERLIEPVVRHPLLTEWRGTHTQIATTLTACAAAKPGSKLKRDAPKQAETLLRDIGGVLESEYRCMVTARDPVSDELIATYRG